MTGYILNFTVYTLAMVGILVLAFFVFKKTMVTGKKMKPKERLIRIEDALNLSDKKTMYVMNIANERFFVASDIERTVCLAKLESKALPQKVDFSQSPIKQVNAKSKSKINDRSELVVKKNNVEAKMKNLQRQKEYEHQQFIKAQEKRKQQSLPNGLSIKKKELDFDAQIDTLKNSLDNANEMTTSALSKLSFSLNEKKQQIPKVSPLERVYNETMNNVGNISSMGNLGEEKSLDDKISEAVDVGVVNGSRQNTDRNIVKRGGIGQGVVNSNVMMSNEHAAPKRNVLQGFSKGPIDLRNSKRQVDTVNSTNKVIGQGLNNQGSYHNIVQQQPMSVSGLSNGQMSYQQDQRSIGGIGQMAQNPINRNMPPQGAFNNVNIQQQQQIKNNNQNVNMVSDSIVRDTRQPIFRQLSTKLQ